MIERKVPIDALRRGTLGWALSLGIGLVLGLALQRAGLDVAWWLLGVALATTSLGALVPILSDAGLLPTQLGTAALGTASRASSGRSSSSRSSSPVRTAPQPSCCS